MLFLMIDLLFCNIIHPFAAQTCSYGMLFLGFALSGQSWLEKEDAQDGEHDEKFQQYDDPKRAAPGHIAKSLNIEMPYPYEWVAGVFHGVKSRDLSFNGNNLLGFFINLGEKVFARGEF